MKRAAALALISMLGACERGQVAESEESAIINRAKSLEMASDASVNVSIAAIASEAEDAPVGEDAAIVENASAAK